MAKKAVVGSIFSPFCAGAVRTGVSSAALFLLAGADAAAWAQTDWELTAQLEGSLSFTDNALLESIDPESDFIFSIDAGVGAAKQTPRTSVLFNYNLGYDLYTNVDELNGYRQGLTTTNSFTLVDDLLFLNLRGGIRERDGGTNLQTPATERTINTRRTTQFTALINPYLQTELGGFAGLRASAQYGVTEFADPDVGSSGTQDDDRMWSGDFSLRSLPGRSNRLEWEVFAQASADDDDFESQNYGAVVYVGVGQSLRLLGRGGYDQTEGRRNGLDISDAFWRGGFEFRPSQATYFRAEAGERYGGSSYEASFRHEVAERVQIEASYTEALQTDQQRLLGNLPEALLGEDGLPIGDTPIDNEITDSAPLSKTVRLSLRTEIGGAKIRVSAHQMTREFDFYVSPGVLAEDETLGASLSIDRSLGRRTDVGLSLSFDDHDSDVGARAIDGIHGTLHGSYKLGNTVALRAEYAYQQREDRLGVKVDENVIMLSISKSW